MEKFSPRQEAYIKVMETLPSRLKETLKAIEEIQPCTYQQITKHLKTTTNNSTSRTSELKYLGLICTAGTTRVGDNSQDLFRVCTEDFTGTNKANVFIWTCPLAPTIILTITGTTATILA